MRTSNASVQICVSSLLFFVLCAPAWPARASDADADGVPDAADDCAYAPDPAQRDAGGVGEGSGPDGIGDACQCGDVTGDGRVTSADAAAISRSLLVPPAAQLARPELCDVGGSLGCSVADSTLLSRALAAPPTAKLAPQCHRPRTVVVQGDTQTLTRLSSFAALWDETQRLICAAREERAIDFVLATGDIVEDFGMSSPAQIAHADTAYDILDACGIAQALPGGNHDTSCTYQGCPPPPWDWSVYLAFLRDRPLHRPASRSPSGLSFAGPLFYDVWTLVMPFAADVHEEAWASGVLAAAPKERRFWLVEHDAVLSPSGAPNPARASARLAAKDSTRVLGVIGGHFIPAPSQRRWLFSALPNGQLALFSNYQELDPATRQQEPFTEVTLLEYLPIPRRWCARDYDFLSGVADRFGPRKCF